MKNALCLSVSLILFAFGFLPITASSDEIKLPDNSAKIKFLWPSEKGGKYPEQLLVKEKGTKESASPFGKISGTARILNTSSEKAVMETVIYELPVEKGFSAFVVETKLLDGLAITSGKYEKPILAIPSILPPPDLKHTFTFKIAAFAPPSDKPVPTTGPVVLYNDDLSVLMFSPLDNFMESMQAPVGKEWWCGFGGTLDNIPAGTTHRILVVNGTGINAVFEKWGEIIRKWHGREIPSSHADIGLSHLGYYTDNGGYYYYNTAPDMNYHDTLMAVKKDADEKNIPYGYFQIDSWWYPKYGDNSLFFAFSGGALLWEPMPELFPAGLASFQKELGLPLVAHNRWYDEHSPYCDRYECVYGHGQKKPALPVDPKFWDEIMDNAVGYGVEVYEQDWLHTQMNMIPWLRSGWGNAASWFDSMMKAADERDLTVQLCMASPEFFLQQMKHDNVTHVRTSGDYLAGAPKTYHWPRFHKVSMLSYATGMWPWKDVYLSSSGQRTIRNEKFSFEETLISNLSGGPVGPGDKIGTTDRELLMKTCREDGLLLKPDKPAMPIDRMFLDRKKPWITVTETSHNVGKTVYLSAFNLWPASMKEPYVTFDELGLVGDHAVFNFRTKEIILDADRVDFGKMPRDKAFYYVLIPVLPNGQFVIGETLKFVTASKDRFTAIRYNKDVLFIDISGVPEEVVPVSIYSPFKPKKIMGSISSPNNDNFDGGVITISIKIPSSGSAFIELE
jgi:hypothetical protein